MTPTFSYSHTFTLDKAHFTECYNESVSSDYSIKAYFKALFLSFFGMALVLFTDINAYAAWFVFSLGVLEALSVYYQQPWWVLRQMLSKVAKGDVTLIINEIGIYTKSFYVNNSILWQEVFSLKATNKGWLVSHPLGKNYISNRCLSDEAQAFIASKI